MGVAAAAAIVSAKKRKRPHSFETNPSIRKRQQNRLLRKLRVSEILSHDIYQYHIFTCIFIFSRIFILAVVHLF